MSSAPLTASRFTLWFAAVITVVLGGVYVVAQQVIRQSANDPQVQIAEELAIALATGVTPDEVFAGAAPTDVRNTLAPFAIIFNDAGLPIAGTARLNDQPPVPPAGVLAYALTHGEHWLTWQPERGLRFAAVVVPYRGARTGTVLVARSLRLAEDRTAQMLGLVFLIWLGTMFVLISIGFGLHRPLRLRHRDIV